MSARINYYTCSTCAQRTVTVDRDEGVTPMMLGCRVTPGCDGKAFSAGYPTVLPKFLGEPTHEWYTPRGDEFEKLSREMQEHVQRGGLDIRLIERGD